MAYQTGTVVVNLDDLDGTPAPTSHVYVTIAGVDPPRVADTDGRTVLGGTLHSEVTDGTATLTLPATDDPTLNPTGFGYTLTARTPGREAVTVSFDLPAGSTRYLSDLLDAPEASFDPTATYLTAGDLSGLTLDGGTP